MHYEEMLPPAGLASYIKCFWMLENNADGKQALEKVLPDACPELIIHYGEQFRIREEKGRIKKQPYGFVFGPLTKYIEIGPTGHSGMIAARFFPGGLASFLSVPVKDLTNRYVSLKDLFGKAGTELEKRVRAAKSSGERKELLEDFLFSQLNGKEEQPLLPHRLLEQVAGREKPVKITELSKHLNVSSRQLERKFNARIGMTPKLFLRIVRFQNVFRILHRRKIKSLTDLTYEAGYFDQSHFYRDFKAFAGQSPKEHFKEDAVLTKLFTSGA